MRRTSPKGAKSGRASVLPSFRTESKASVRNPLALYHLQGDPSTPLRSVFGMTYKEKAPSLRELAAEQMRSSLKELLLFKSTIFNYSFRHGCAVPPPSWREA